MMAKSFHISRYASQGVTMRFSTSSCLDSIFWRKLSPSSTLPTHNRSLLLESRHIHHGHCHGYQRRFPSYMLSKKIWKPIYYNHSTGRKTVSRQSGYFCRPCAHQMAPSPVPPIASFSSSSKPPENVFHTCLRAGNRTRAPFQVFLPSAHQSRCFVPNVYQPACTQYFERSLSTPCLHHPTTDDTDGGRAAAR